MPNGLCYGDNLAVLRNEIASDSIVPSNSSDSGRSTSRRGGR